MEVALHLRHILDLERVNRWQTYLWVEILDAQLWMSVISAVCSYLEVHWHLDGLHLEQAERLLLLIEQLLQKT